MMPDERVHIYYKGAVQGVGFRATTQRIAESFGLKGWARNLNDGRVEVLGEGKKDDIERFVVKIASIFNRYISDSDIEWAEATGEYDGFDIR